MGQYNQLYAYLNNIQVIRKWMSIFIWFSLWIWTWSSTTNFYSGSVPLCQEEPNPLPPFWRKPEPGLVFWELIIRWSCLNSELSRLGLGILDIIIRRSKFWIARATVLQGGRGRWWLWGMWPGETFWTLFGDNDDADQKTIIFEIFKLQTIPLILKMWVCIV